MSNNHPNQDGYWIYRGGNHICIMHQLDGISGSIGMIEIKESQWVPAVDTFQAALQELCDKANSK